MINSTKSPEIGHLIFPKGAKEIQLGKNGLINGVGTTGHPYTKKNSTLILTSHDRQI